MKQAWIQFLQEALSRSNGMDNTVLQTLYFINSMAIPSSPISPPLYNVSTTNYAPFEQHNPSRYPTNMDKPLMQSMPIHRVEPYQSQKISKTNPSSNTKQ
jgi:hypothetical protein